MATVGQVSSHRNSVETPADDGNVFFRCCLIHISPLISGTDPQKPLAVDFDVATLRSERSIDPLDGFEIVRPNGKRVWLCRPRWKRKKASLNGVNDLGDSLTFPYNRDQYS